MAAVELLVATTGLCVPRAHLVRPTHVSLVSATCIRREHLLARWQHHRRLSVHPVDDPRLALPRGRGSFAGRSMHHKAALCKGGHADVGKTDDGQVLHSLIKSLACKGWYLFPFRYST